MDLLDAGVLILVCLGLVFRCFGLTVREGKIAVQTFAAKVEPQEG